MAERYAAETLVTFATQLLRGAGLDPDKAATQARLLVEGDLMGHTTHGLALLPPNLAAARDGRMRPTGEIEILAETPAVATWDGLYLPGLWLTQRAVDAALAKARRLGIGVVSVRRSSHIGCLATFLVQAASEGMMLIIASSDPSVASVAPFGGRKALYTPNPIAIGIPTDADPILIDISASITTNGMSARLAAEGREGDHAWWLDEDGNPTRDPTAIAAGRAGSILPVGGLDHGHKGYGLALTIESLTQALSGFGRADAPTVWGASVYVQALDPAAFGGSDAFIRQSGWLRRACADNPPRPGVGAVRLPGEQAMKRRRQALEEGVELYPGIMRTLGAEAERAGIPIPSPI